MRNTIIAAALLLLGGCSAAVVDYSPPSTHVYRTRADYNNLVPVALSVDRSRLISFPSPGDLYTNGVLAIPTLLEGGYLLDNRGISSTVAFLRMTYLEYAALRVPPSPDQLMAMIIDKEPLIDMYNCGNRWRFHNIVQEVNDIIRNGNLGEYRKLYPK
jgi:hypothetical protein